MTIEASANGLGHLKVEVVLLTNVPAYSKHAPHGTAKAVESRAISAIEVCLDVGMRARRTAVHHGSNGHVSSDVFMIVLSFERLLQVR